MPNLRDVMTVFDSISMLALVAAYESAWPKLAVLRSGSRLLDEACGMLSRPNPIA
jgi:hypothetical protein